LGSRTDYRAPKVAYFREHYLSRLVEWADTQNIGPKLRRGGHRSKGSAERRGKMSGCTSIEERPAIVAQRQRAGGWEGDTVCGSHGNRTYFDSGGPFNFVPRSMQNER